MLHVPQGDEKPTLRAYSVASSDQESHSFHLLFKYIPQGKASEFVWSLRGGEPLKFTGPFGKLFFKEPPTEQIVFLNTGTGLAQHYSYLTSNLDKYPNCRFKMLFGLSNSKEVYYQNELEKLREKYSHFQYEFVFSDPELTSPSLTPIKRGYLQNHLSFFNFMKTPSTFYLCGNRAMLLAVREHLEFNHFPKELILCEAFD